MIDGNLAVLVGMAIVVGAYEVGKVAAGHHWNAYVAAERRSLARFVRDRLADEGQAAPGTALALEIAGREALE